MALKTCVDPMFGPAYGNRMMHNAGLRAVEEEEAATVRDHLEKICEKKDRDGLDNWRGYYRRHLHQFDLQLQERVRLYADCIRPEDRNVIHSFVQHVALHQYRMEHWRDGDKIDRMDDFDELDFVVEHNNVDFGPYKELSGYQVERIVELFSLQIR